jgi:hypothetical protein
MADLPVLDDWDNEHPDGWDYEAVLKEHDVQVVYEKDDEFSGWSLSWKEGVMFIGETTEARAREAAALFISLWLRNVSASFADKLMQGYLMWLENTDISVI